MINYNNKNKSKYERVILIILLTMLSVFLVSCNPNNLETSLSDYSAVGDEPSLSSESITSELDPESDEDCTASIEESTDEIIQNETKPEKEEDVFDLEKELVDFEPEIANTYGSNLLCYYMKVSNEIEYSFDMVNGIPRSDDDKVYLFELAGYQGEVGFLDMTPVTSANKGRHMTFRVPFEERHLFARFIPTVLVDGEYKAIAVGQFISNPEALAANHTAYPLIGSKKGMLLDGTTVGSDLLKELNVKRLVYNMPLSLITGETDDPNFPTIEYEYNGEIYYFNGHMIMIYDSLFEYLTDEGFYCTAIILNDWNKKTPELIHPKSRSRTGESLYYSFNTSEVPGVRLTEAVAMFLANRYSGEHGMVYDWVIANEINQHAVWNYMATDNLGYYVNSFEQSFRTFYNAIKANYRNANVYFSIDHDWNNNWGNNRRFFNGRDLVYAFNEAAKAHGNYDWGLSIHPYPAPLTKVRFWRGTYDKSEEASVVTPMNLSAVTDVMTKDEFLDTKGNVRSIAVTELGFSSKSSERLQAAAYAYCYYIMEDNEYIDSFLMNRQTDDNDSLRSGLALGLFNKDYSEKYIVDVFRNIDTDKGKEYIPEMLEIIGADSLEEALDWAR